MTPDNESVEGSTSPIPKFRFEVDFGTELKGIAFQEVSGIDMEDQVVEYGKSNSPLLSGKKMPGTTKYGNITLKHGLFVNNNAFWDWYNQIRMNTITRLTVLIKLLDENGKATMQWTLNNAWPTKVFGTDLKSNGNEVVVDYIEIAHGQPIISNG
jgi:phage tail-like protein